MFSKFFHNISMGIGTGKSSIFEMSKSEQSHFHLDGFLLACELFEVDVVEAIHSELMRVMNSLN